MWIAKNPEQASKTFPTICDLPAILIGRNFEDPTWSNRQFRTTSPAPFLSRSASDESL